MSPVARFRDNPRRAVLGGVALVLVAAFLFAGLRVGAEGDVSVAPAPSATVPPGGDRLIFWAKCEEIAQLSDGELAGWKARGVDGFVCMTGRLAGLGGDQRLAADSEKGVRGSDYELLRLLRDSDIARRAADAGMKLYLGAYFSNYRNTATPLADWFDDGSWSGQILPRIADLGETARDLGFSGVAFDQELYPQAGGVTSATWDWDYPGNTHTQSDVRNAATERGEQLMRELLDAFPEAEIVVYHYAFPGDWKELIREQASGRPNTSANTVHVDFWDGMTRSEGYSAIRFYESIFYKTPHLGDWEAALTYEVNSAFATFSREFENWDHAASRVYLSPFSWINAGPSEESAFDDARPVDYVEEQLLTFRRWSMGGEFANYVYGGLRSVEYDPYEEAIQRASGEEADDPGTAPELTVDRGHDPAAITGTATDDLAIRAVRWRDDRGTSGVALLRWKVRSGNFSTGYVWKTVWTIPRDALADDATTVEISAEDIKGLESQWTAAELR